MLTTVTICELFVLFIILDYDYVMIVSACLLTVRYESDVYISIVWHVSHIPRCNIQLGFQGPPVKLFNVRIKALPYQFYFSAEHHILVQKLDKENEDLRKQLASHNSRISELNQDLQNEKEAATRGPTAAAKEHMSRLKQQIQEKDDEFQGGVLLLDYYDDYFQLTVCVVFIVGRVILSKS